MVMDYQTEMKLTNTYTDALNSDTDSDGLSDGDEVNEYSTESIEP